MPRKPTKDRDPTELVTLQIRFREEMRRRLQDAADQSGTSMNAEAVGRLEQSFHEDELFGKPATRALLREIASQIQHAEAAVGKSWNEDPATYWAVRDLVADAVRRSGPKPPNFDEANAIRIEIEQKGEATKELLSVLTDWRAIRQANALMMHIDGGMMIEAPEEEWRNPDEPERPLTEQERADVRRALSMWKEDEAETLELHKKLNDLLVPWRAAKTGGKVIYKHVTSGNEQEEV